MKDLVTLPSKKYENIMAIISNNNNHYNNYNKEEINPTYTDIDLLPNLQNINMDANIGIDNYMKNELKSFLKTQLTV